MTRKTRKLSPAQLNVLDALADYAPEPGLVAMFHPGTVRTLRDRGLVRAAAGPEGHAAITITPAGLAALNQEPTR
jgi:hypothetical protein